MTPTERAKVALHEIVPKSEFIPTYMVNYLAAEIEAAEDDALERAAVLCDDLRTSTLRMADTEGLPDYSRIVSERTNVLLYMAEGIRALKHAVKKSLE